MRPNEQVNLQQAGEMHFVHDKDKMIAVYVNPRGKIVVGSIRDSLAVNEDVFERWKQVMADGVKALVAGAVKNGSLVVRRGSGQLESN